MNSLDTEEPLGQGERWAALEALATVVAAVILFNRPSFHEIEHRRYRGGGRSLSGTDRF